MYTNCGTLEEADIVQYTQNTPQQHKIHIYDTNTVYQI